MVINLIFEIYRLRSILRFSRLRETKVADALLLTLKVLTYSALFKTASVSRKCLKTITKDMIRSAPFFAPEEGRLYSQAIMHIALYIAVRFNFLQIATPISIISFVILQFLIFTPRNYTETVNYLRLSET